MVEIAKYAAIMLLVAIVALAIIYVPKARLFQAGMSKSSSSIVPTSTIQAETINTTTAAPTSTVGKYCTPSNSSFVYVGNGNFTTGTYSGWTVIGNSFGSAPLNLSQANIDGYYYVNKWSGYYGNYAAVSFNPKLKRTPGSISSTFIVLEPYLNFQIYSPKSNLLYLEIIPQSGSPVYYYYDTLSGQYTNRTDQFAYASIDISKYSCQTVSVRIVSNTGPLEDDGTFIAVGNFYQSAYPMQTIGILVNQS